MENAVKFYNSNANGFYFIGYSVKFIGETKFLVIDVLYKNANKTFSIYKPYTEIVEEELKRRNAFDECSNSICIIYRNDKLKFDFEL